MHKRKLIAAALTVSALAIAVPVALAQGSSTKQTSTAASKASSKGARARPAGATRGTGPGFGGPGGQAVHSVSVVLDKAGTGFVTMTTDSGKVESVDTTAGTIKVLEASGSVTYQTVTLTIPSDATVTLDGKTSALTDLTAGDQVSVSSSSDGTTVFATDSSFHPTGGAPSGGPGQNGRPAGPGWGDGQSPPSSTTTSTTSSS